MRIETRNHLQGELGSAKVYLEREHCAAKKRIRDRKIAKVKRVSVG